MTPLSRLRLSEEIITSWEQMGLPIGPADSTLRMIEEEVAALGHVVEEGPLLALRVEAVIKRYKAMAEKLKLGMN